MEAGERADGGCHYNSLSFMHPPRQRPRCRQTRHLFEIALLLPGEGLFLLAGGELLDGRVEDVDQAPRRLDEEVTGNASPVCSMTMYWLHCLSNVQSVWCPPMK